MKVIIIKSKSNEEPEQQDAPPTIDNWTPYDPRPTKEAIRDFHSTYEPFMEHPQNIIQSESHLRELVGEANVRVRVHSLKLPEILKSGRLKSQHETQTSSGYNDPDLRFDSERRMFSVPKRGEGKGYHDYRDMPIYGHLKSNDEDEYDGRNDELFAYGDVDFFMHHHVHKRATFSMDDSLNWGGILPSKMTDPKYYSHAWQIFDSKKENPKFGYHYAGELLSQYPTISDLSRDEDGSTSFPYAEAQIHHGVHLDTDVHHAIIRSHTPYGSEKYQQTRIMNAAKALHDHGMKYQIQRPDGSLGKMVYPDTDSLPEYEEYIKKSIGEDVQKAIDENWEPPQSAWDRLSTKYGWNRDEEFPADKVAEYKQKYKGYFEHHVPVVRLRSGDIGKILKTGYLKNISNSTSSRKATGNYMSERQSKENDFFGLSGSVRSDKRPIYGYMMDFPTKTDYSSMSAFSNTWQGHDDDHLTVSAYGDVDLLVHPALKKFTTVVRGDSFSDPVVPHHVNNLHPATNVYDDAHLEPYTEAQIHSRVRVPSDALGLVFRQLPPDDKLQARLKEAGVKWSHAPSPTLFGSALTRPFKEHPHYGKHPISAFMEDHYPHIKQALTIPPEILERGISKALEEDDIMPYDDPDAWKKPFAEYAHDRADISQGTSLALRLQTIAPHVAVIRDYQEAPAPVRGTQRVYHGTQESSMPSILQSGLITGGGKAGNRTPVLATRHPQDPKDGRGFYGTHTLIADIDPKQVLRGYEDGDVAALSHVAPYQIRAIYVPRNDPNKGFSPRTIGIPPGEGNWEKLHETMDKWRSDHDASIEAAKARGEETPYEVSKAINDDNDYDWEEATRYKPVGENWSPPQSAWDRLKRLGVNVDKEYPPEEVARFKAKHSGKLDNHVTLIRTDSEYLPKILRDGYLKNIANRTSSKKTNEDWMDKRVKAENEFFGLWDSRSNKRPIYGYMEESPVKDSEGKWSRVKDFNEGVTNYGDVDLIVHPHLHKRTTVTNGDSLFRRVIPHLIHDLHPATGLGEPAEIYTEAQIHGGVKLNKDVLGVVFRKHPPDENLQSLLSDKGVKWSHAPATTTYKFDTTAYRNHPNYGKSPLAAFTEDHLPNIKEGVTLPQQIRDDREVKKALGDSYHSDATEGEWEPYEPKPDTMMVNSAWRAQLLNDVNLRKPEFQARVEKHIKKMLDGVAPRIRVRSYVLPDILEAGRFKSQHETHGSYGTFSPSARRTYEKDAFSPPFDEQGWYKHHRDAPIYGHLNVGGVAVANNLNQYGTTDVVLKPELAKRSTFTFGDSLDGQEWEILPSKVTDPHVWSHNFKKIPAYDLMDIKDHDDLSHLPPYRRVIYTEAQIHGGVHNEDIDHVIFHNENVDQNVVDALHRHGISYKMKLPNGSYSKIMGVTSRVPKNVKAETMSLPFDEFRKAMNSTHPEEIGGRKLRLISTNVPNLAIYSTNKEHELEHGVIVDNGVVHEPIHYGSMMAHSHAVEWQAPENVAKSLGDNEHILYHGTSAPDISSSDLKPSSAGMNGVLGEGIYMTHNPDLASHYGQDYGYNKGRILKARAHINNPLVIDATEGINHRIAPEIEEQYQNSGFDSIVAGLRVPAFDVRVGGKWHPIRDRFDLHDLTGMAKDAGHDALIMRGYDENMPSDHDETVLWDNSKLEHLGEHTSKAITQPSDAQKEAGNYKKEHYKVHGMDISIENPKGSTRSGVDKGGNAWSRTMKHDYGYIRGFVGVDKDHVDVIVGDDKESPYAYIVDQVNSHTGKFDEHKVVLGFDSQEEAEKAYLSNYPKGWKGLGAITEVSIKAFKGWLGGNGHKFPFAVIKGLGMPNRTVVVVRLSK